MQNKETPLYFEELAILQFFDLGKTHVMSSDCTVKQSPRWFTYMEITHVKEIKYAYLQVKMRFLWLQVANS